MDPDKVVALVKDSELRGRGGAGFPCGLKWSFLPKDRKETLMCVNGDESEPATFNNRLLIEHDPHQFIEGILIACFATKATTAYVYLRFEYIKAFRILEAAIAEARAGGHLGKNIYGSGFDLEIYCHRGAGAYICGEETGLIESLEGKRGWPRIKPPFPAIEGAFRKPTVVNNVETLCCVPHIVERGADWFKSIGTPKSYGPKLYCVSGHVNKQVCVELPLGITCRGLDRRARGGRLEGPEGEGRPCRAGSAWACSRPMNSTLRSTSRACASPAASASGTAAVTVIDDQTSIVDYLYNMCPLLRPRKLRPVHALPRGDGLDVQDRSSGSRRAAAGWKTSNPGRTSHEQHGHHAGHHDLRPRRRRGVAAGRTPWRSSGPRSRSTSGPTRPAGRGPSAFKKRSPGRRSTAAPVVGPSRCRS